MAQVGVVKSLDGGVFYAKDSSGNIRELSIGDAISENEVVYGDSSNQTSAKVEMELSGNDIIVLNQAQQQLIDSSLNQVTFGNEEVIFSKGDINTTFENADLSAWNNTTDDVSDDMETAAGDPTQQETQAGEEEPTEDGRVTARFSARDGSSTDVRSDLRDGDFDGENPETPQEQIPTELLNPTAVAGVTPTTPTPVAPDASAVGAVVVNEAGLNNDEDNSEIAEVRVDGYTIVGGGTGTYGNIDFVDGKWVYTLTYRFEHTGEGTDTAEDADTVTITVQDAQGNTFTVEVNVNIVDDVPTITVETPATGAYGSEITGKVAIEFGADGEKSI
ncbi:VCBS domain-containing protein, partial [Aliarcobacter butzleri]|uniref:VCBS domain-containing protein n=1 Tax=Aliarcobacter butzleri TaxID=28197 RepID=UPI002B255F01